jgi:hypothetical protein
MSHYVQVVKLVLESEGVTLNTETLLTIAEDHPHPQSVRDSGVNCIRTIFEANLLKTDGNNKKRTQSRLCISYSLFNSASVQMWNGTPDGSGLFGSIKIVNANSSPWAIG